MREGEWEGVANFAPNTQLEYKFLLVNDQGVALRWEDGPNRGFTVPDVDVELGEVWRVPHSRASHVSAPIRKPLLTVGTVMNGCRLRPGTRP